LKKQLTIQIIQDNDGAAATESLCFNKSGKTNADMRDEVSVHFVRYMAIKKEEETRIESNVYNLSWSALSCGRIFIEHALTMRHTHIPKLVCEYIPTGIRSVNRP
jgi:hypothetical protein